MASNCLYITSTEQGSGKSTIALGTMEILLRKIERVGFFRPIMNPRTQEGEDPDLHLIRDHFHLDMPYEAMYGISLQEAELLMSQGKRDQMFEQIIEKYNQAKSYADFLLCEGSYFLSSVTALKVSDLDPAIIKNLSCPVLMVAKGRGLSTEDVVSRTNVGMESLLSKSCEVISVIVNRVASADQGKDIIARLKEQEMYKETALFAIPEDSVIGHPSVAEVATALNARVLFGEQDMYRHVSGFIVAAMHLHHFLSRIKSGNMVITPGDRSDILLASMASFSSDRMEKISGIVLTGGQVPEDTVMDLLKGYADMIPVLSVDMDTYPTAVAVENLRFSMTPGDERKITRALALFEENIDVEKFGDLIVAAESTVMTPKSFEFMVMQRARELKKRIVLPEGQEDRILMATEDLIRRKIVDITLLGNKEAITQRIGQLGLHMGDVEIIDPATSPHLEEFAKTYVELRKHKNHTMEDARDRMLDLNYFGTMMVYHGMADGMVSGSIHSTAATIKPSFEIIKTKPGCNVVSSIFFMCLDDKVLVYGDCAINPNPDVPALAQIAVASAQTAKMFGIDPRVAMLSYSTGTSGKGKDVDKVREATEIVRGMNPDFLVEGPIQYDAAVDPHVAKTKLPDSPVAGRATVFIFPDLNTGNNSYKAVQRSSGAIAVGPVLQGLNKPVNDLSRGCLVSDIINTVAITAVQAGENK